MGRFWIGVLAAAAIGCMATVAPAQDMRDVVKSRHAHFKQMGAAMKGMSDELKSGKPSAPKVQDYAKRLDDLAPQIPSWFPKGSGPDAGVATHAKAAVWAKPDDFKKDADALVVEAHKLDLIASGGDMAAVGPQLKAVGQACGTCHKVFREKED